LIEQSELEIEEGEVKASIDEQAFATGLVTLTLSNVVLMSDDIIKLKKQANALWAQEQEYIHMPFHVPYFLQFCRQTDENIMSDPIVDIKVPNKAAAEKHLSLQAQSVAEFLERMDEKASS